MLINNYYYFNSGLKGYSNQRLRPFYNDSVKNRSTNTFKIIDNHAFCWLSTESSDTYLSFNNKKSYILAKWRSDFPSHQDLTYDEISSLASRSRDVSKWFASTSVEFSIYTDAPDWFLESGQDVNDWTKELQEKYRLLKQIYLDHNTNVNKLAQDTKQKMSDLDKSLQTKLKSELVDNPELAISLLTSQALPLEIHLKAFEFKTKDDAKQFISKELKAFRYRVYQDYLSGNKTGNDLINLLLEK